MKAEYINPFLEAFSTVVEQVLCVKPTQGKVFVKDGSQKSGEVAITIGVTGDLSGNIMFNFSKETGKIIASKMMMGMEVKEFDDMAKSAISELANMIAGNSTMYFSNIGVKIDITPPSMYTGTDMSFYSYKSKAICVPMIFQGYEVAIDLAID